MQNQEHDIITDRFERLALEMFTLFPDLDLRFTLESGARCCRFSAAAVSAKQVEIGLEHDNIAASLHDAIFAVKEIARIFDA